MLKQFAIFTVLVAGCLEAETTFATIPFPFRVGRVDFPAGEYSFVCSERMLKIQPMSSRLAPSVFAGIVDPPPPTKSEHEAAAEFHRYGDRYFLSKVWGGHEDPACRLVMTADEKELVRLSRANLSLSRAAKK